MYHYALQFMRTERVDMSNTPRNLVNRKLALPLTVIVFLCMLVLSLEAQAAVSVNNASPSTVTLTPDKTFTIKLAGTNLHLARAAQAVGARQVEGNISVLYQARSATSAELRLQLRGNVAGASYTVYLTDGQRRLAAVPLRITIGGSAAPAAPATTAINRNPVSTPYALQQKGINVTNPGPRQPGSGAAPPPPAPLVTSVSPAEATLPPGGTVTVTLVGQNLNSLGRVEVHQAGRKVNNVVAQLQQTSSSTLNRRKVTASTFSAGGGVYQLVPFSASGAVRMPSHAITMPPPRTDTRISQITPANLTLQREKPMSLTISGKELNELTAVQVLRNGRVVREVNAVLAAAASRTDTARTFTLKANRDAATGSYSLRLLKGNTRVNSPPVTITVPAPPAAPTTPVATGQTMTPLPRFQPITVDAGTLRMTGAPITPTSPIQAPPPIHSAVDLECCVVQDFGGGYANFSVKNIGTSPAINVTFEGKTVARLQDNAEQRPDLRPLTCKPSIQFTPGHFSITSANWATRLFPVMEGGVLVRYGLEGTCTFTAKLNGPLAPGETASIVQGVDPVSDAPHYQLTWGLEARVDAIIDVNRGNNAYRGPYPWWNEPSTGTYSGTIQPARQDK
jgi:hypothetical protein